MRFTGVELINQALNEPGILSECYNMFRNYSILNAIALRKQCKSSGLELGPCASYSRWKELGGQVKRGSKALWVCIPCTYKAKEKHTINGEEVELDVKHVKGFTWKPFVFTLAQVDIAKPPEQKSSFWDSEKALNTLGIKRIPFDSVLGTSMGYTTDEGIAINPMNPHKTRTIVHEMAHYLLHKGQKPEASHEVEAELVSYIVCGSLNIQGAEESRGYIQYYMESNELPEKTAMKVLACANKILKGGC